MDHNILTEKLVKFGCIGDTLNWFKSYLTNRKQMCKVNQTTSNCRTISCGVPQSTLISVYNAIILPHFDYCSLVWDIGNAYLLEKLQKMQNRAARVITGKSHDVRSKDILQELSWQPLMERWGNKRRYLCIKSRMANT